MMLVWGLVVDLDIRIVVATNLILNMLVEKQNVSSLRFPYLECYKGFVLSNPILEVQTCKYTSEKDTCL